VTVRRYQVDWAVWIDGELNQWRAPWINGALVHAALFRRWHRPSTGLYGKYRNFNAAGRTVLLWEGGRRSKPHQKSPSQLRLNANEIALQFLARQRGEGKVRSPATIGK